MQTKKRSLFETCCNVGTGLLTAYLAWVHIVIPWATIFEADLNSLGIVEIMMINCTFTVISVVRGYIWRRVFNRHE